MSGEYLVDPDGLEKIAAGINDTVAELDKLGMAGAGAAGVGFEGVGLNATQLGHGGLAQAMGGFCERWGWQVNQLVDDAHQITRHLGLTAGAYQQLEEYNTGLFKELAADVACDPHDTRPAGEQTWTELEERSADRLIRPTTSEDTQRAAEHAGQAWGQVGDDIVETVTLPGRGVEEAIRWGQRVAGDRDAGEHP